MTPGTITHYENFPVASWLCPPALRPAVAAIYHFARVADDIADEGQAPPAQRLADLGAYRAELQAAAAPVRTAAAPRWQHIFGPLAQAIAQHRLPVALLDALLQAFEQDVRHTAAGAVAPSQAALLDYCTRSANPVGRLLLHLYGIDDPLARQRSDALCSALQLINFWQDLSQDVARGRYYLPADRCAALGIDPRAPARSARTAQLIAELSAEAAALMAQGQPLVHQIPGRAGWELRLVVQGGLRILERIAQHHYDSARHRPKLTRYEAPLLLWRALGMRA